MAIAAIVLHTESASLQELLKFLQGKPFVYEAQAANDANIAATVETGAGELMKCLQELQDLPEVLDLQLVYVNYEEDAEAEEGIACPPLASILTKPGR